VTPRLTRAVPSFVAPEDLVYGREEVGGMLVGFFDENAKIIEEGALPEPFSFTLLPPAGTRSPLISNEPVRFFPRWKRLPSGASSTARSPSHQTICR
jgi:hypothetical protein